MTQPREYTVVLVPKDIPMANASDVRFVPVTIDTPRQDSQFKTDIENHLTLTGRIDSWSFHKHWDIETVIRADVSPSSRVKDALLQFDRPHNSWMNGYRPYTFYVDDPELDAKISTKLALSPSVEDRLKTWMNDVRQGIKSAGVEPRAWNIHDAMVDVAVKQNPDLLDDIVNRVDYRVQAFHDTLVSEAMDNTNHVVGRL